MNNSTANALLTGQGPTVDNTSTVDMQTILDEWRKSKKYVEQYTKDFQALDSLVDAVAIKRDEKNPFVGDVTLAGLVRQIPRDSLEQLPVFSAVLNGSKETIQALIGTFLLKKFIFNESTFGKGLLSTLQIGAEEALTHGFASFICTTGTMISDFGTTLKLLHYDDLGIEPGVQDSNEIGFSYVTANLTRTRVKKIRDNAKANPNTSWNVESLDRVLDLQPRTRNYSRFEPVTRSNHNGEADGPTYQFVTRKEVGPGGVDVTFCPDLEDAELRVLNSRSKFGYPRVMMLVIDPVALNPFGISRVRLASPMQNFMNIYLGNVAAMLLLNSAPPILKRGRFTKPVQAKRNAVWETLDQNAQADFKNMDNGSLEKFVELANWISQQIAIIMGRGPANRPQQSKTAPGVKNTEEKEDNATNQITKILENFLRQYALSGLDTLLSEQEGEEVLIVDDETKIAVNNVAPGTIGDDNKFKMNWEDFYAAIETMEVEVTVSISKDEMEEKKRADVQDMLTVLAQNAEALGPETQAKVQQLTDLLMQDIVPSVKPITVGSATPPAATPGAGQAAIGSQIHETGDLVRLFGMTTDVGIRNAILRSLGLPENAQALKPELVNPINPVAQTTIDGGQPHPQPATNLTSK